MKFGYDTTFDVSHFHESNDWGTRNFVYYSKVHFDKIPIREDIIFIMWLCLWFCNYNWNKSLLLFIYEILEILFWRVSSFHMTNLGLLCWNFNNVLVKMLKQKMIGGHWTTTWTEFCHFLTINISRWVILKKNLLRHCETLEGRN